MYHWSLTLHRLGIFIRFCWHHKTCTRFFPLCQIYNFVFFYKAFLIKDKEQCARIYNMQQKGGDMRVLWTHCLKGGFSILFMSRAGKCNINGFYIYGHDQSDTSYLHLLFCCDRFWNYTNEINVGFRLKCNSKQYWTADLGKILGDFSIILCRKNILQVGVFILNHRKKINLVLYHKGECYACSKWGQSDFINFINVIQNGNTLMSAFWPSRLFMLWRHLMSPD